jgi:predicted choloylglycine hydrolase
VYRFCKVKLLLLLVVLNCLISCTKQQNINEPYFKETIVAGSPEQFMEVRHIVIKGSNYAIGTKIAEIAKKINPQIYPSGKPLRNRVQREYIEKNYSILFERMKGVADCYRISLEDNNYDFSGLSQYPALPSGCSVVFYPGAFTENQQHILSRNYDFTTGTFQGKRPEQNEMAVLSRPYIFEIYPDEGFSSLSICAFDLIGGVLGGINSEGLTVAVLADDESISNYGLEPSQGIGMHELLSMRYLLDNCRNADEAKEALLYLKHYYAFIPCHYIIADRNGNSFVFEFSSLRNSTHILDGQGPQCVTNHLLSKYQSVDKFPDESVLNTFTRYKKLHSAIQGKDKFSTDEIKEFNLSVASTGKTFDHPDYAPNRTLWHSLYNIQERSLQVKFYLGETVDPSDSSKTRIQYSDYLKFQLKT